MPMDITLLPYQQAGTGAWVQSVLTKDTLAIAYGNDPWDGTAVSIDTPTKLSDIVAAINATGAMTANTSSCSAWTLSRVRIEVWEAGARTCYVDDVTVGGTVFTFEPKQFACGFMARP